MLIGQLKFPARQPYARQRVKFERKRINKGNGQVSGRRVVQGFCFIALNRLGLEFKLAKVGYLCHSGHEAHSLWDVFSTARAQDRFNR